ncbi:peroxisome assembly protein (Peroxin-2) [Dionaea muscipula]
MSEWLRRQTRNLLGSACAGSNPAVDVGFLFSNGLVKLPLYPSSFVLLRREKYMKRQKVAITEQLILNSTSFIVILSFFIPNLMDRESPSSSSSLPAEVPMADAWVKVYQSLIHQWSHRSLSHQATIPVIISRVNQVDAARLDVEMTAMLKEQLVKVFSLMKPGMLFQYEPELDAFLEFLVWRFSIWVDKPTPGNALMNLRYRDERRMELRGKVRTGLEGPGLTVAQKMWYCIATVGGQYFWARLQSFSAFRRWGDSEQRPLAQQAWILLQRLEGFYKAASVINLVIFLYTGKYRNLIERVLKARLVYGSPNMNRAVSFEYMNRQLVWNEFSEMLLLLLPLLNSSLTKTLLRPFSKDKRSDSAVDETVCAICQASPTIPFIALPCRHRYCYYCLRTRCAATSSFRCARCSEPVTAMQRQGGSLS